MENFINPSEQYLDPIPCLQPIITETVHINAIKMAQMELHKMRVYLSQIEMMTRSIYTNVSSQPHKSLVEKEIGEIALGESVNLTLFLEEMKKNQLRTNALFENS